MTRSLALAAAMLLAGCATPATHLSPGARYVAMGSSYAAGPGLGAVQPGTPERCSRSTVNYPSLLAEKLDLALADVTCSGATTEHVLGSWDELPAQLDAVTPDTRLVTVTIGGNDLGYMGIMFGGSCRTYGELRPGEPCPAVEAPSEVAYAKVGTNLRRIASEVHRRSPSATLVFVTYTSLVPDPPCPQLPLDAATAELARRVAGELAAITARAAQDGEALVLRLDRLSQDHTPCSAAPWATGLPRNYDGSTGAPWHPNTAGMRAAADALAELLAGPVRR